MNPGHRNKTRRLADMSLPPEQRRKKRRKTTKPQSRGVPAQMDHGNSPKGKRRGRDGEKKMKQWRHR